MAQYVITEPAEEDLREIAFYIADDNIDAALSMLDRFTERFEMLASMPQTGRTRDELEPNLRSFPEGSYVVFYREIGQGIEIIRVLHGSRDVDRIFNINPPHY
jgi:toxin ParE1/3/4